MGRFKGRSSVACTACHSQKLKCDGAVPCGRCARLLRECSYPDKKSYVTVPESYIRELERLAASSQASPCNYEDGIPEDPATHSPNPPDLGATWERRIAARAVLSEDCSAERFAHDLRQMALPGNVSGLQEQSGYTYMVLKSDLIEPRMLIKLPSENLAVKLLDTFEDIFCDHHWFLRKDFRQRLMLLLSAPENQSKDRSWLARVSLVFALATSIIYGRKASDGEPPAGLPAGIISPPGSDMFEQAVSLLNVSSEEPTTEDVEALNMMAFYCYSLNRRRMAYTYATQSLAVAKLLHLDRPPSCSTTTGRQAILEHRKRLWWTTFCMERMVVAELGLSPAAYPKDKMGVGRSLSQDIPDSELGQFFEPHLQSLQIEICEAKCQIMEAVGYLRRVPDLETMLFELWPCMSILQSWRQQVPSHILFDFKDGVPAEISQTSYPRGIASIYLRYHQCFTIILRPFLSKELSLRLQGADPKHLETRLTTTLRERLHAIKRGGLQAARNNCRILLDCFDRGILAQYGYWDSLHAFSSLSVLSISRVTAPDLAESTQSNDDDKYLYSQCRSMLRHMVEAGNPASKDHDALLTDIESIVQRMTEGSRCEDPAEKCMENAIPSFDLSQHLWSDVDLVNFSDVLS